MLPLWVILAFTAAISVTAVPLLQEKFKADGYALALWNKLCVAIYIAPFMLHYGAPTDWRFYGLITITSIMYAICDVVYFRSVPKIGSGMVTRLLPSSVVITFVLWFMIDPALLQTYMAQPIKAAAIGVILLFFVWCASLVKKCTISWQGVRMIWPVIAAACIGPIFTKMTLGYAGTQQAPYAYMFFQSIGMVACLSVFQTVKKPVTHRVLFSKTAIQTAIVMGMASTATTFLKTKAIQLVDNPAFVSMILFTDCLWVLLVYKLIGRREQANIFAGLGIVLSAVLIVLVKNWK